MRKKKMDEIKTGFVKANGMEFEVHMCGEGDKFAICLHGFPEYAISCVRMGDALDFLDILG